MTGRGVKRVSMATSSLRSLAQSPTNDIEDPEVPERGYKGEEKGEDATPHKCPVPAP